MHGAGSVGSPAPFDTFNARSMTSVEVATTFVPPNTFSTLLRASHAVVIGPRGSGKTTLLKMLNSEALDQWDRYVALEDRAKPQRTFEGVFVPCDRSWMAQLAYATRDLDDYSAGVIRRTAFSTHVQREFVRTLRYLTQRDRATGTGKFSGVDAAMEARLIGLFADAWRVDLQIPSFSGLIVALSNRLLAVGGMRSQFLALREADRLQRIADATYLHAETIPLISTGLDILETALSDVAIGRFGLLFDELELAPREIRETLFASMRSIDSRIVLKLALSPYALTLEPGPEDPTPGNDYDVVSLSYARRDEATAFCNALFEKMCERRGIKYKDPEDVLGSSVFQTAPSEYGDSDSAYGPDKRLFAIIEDYSRRDSSFARYLKEQNVDLATASAMLESDRAASLRKVTPIVLARIAFLRFDRNGADSTLQKRSRKNPTFYTGKAAVYAMTEGNPRIFTSLIGRILDAFSSESAIDPALQAKVFTQARQTFRAFLRTIPYRAHLARSPGRGILALLDKIGSEFTKSTLSADFKPEPEGSFVVDSRTDDELIDALGKLVNAGAIIHVPDKESDSQFRSIKGKRFRISYLLIPEYKLPLRVLKERSLLNILSRPSSGDDIDLQPGLALDSDNE
jgi:hypothetical protein